MAGGIDWFRWHHGSVTDPKFPLVAKKAGTSFGNVIAVWAFVLESASANDERGTVGPVDFEAIDLMLGADEGTTARILDAMTQRGLIGAGGRIAAWQKRQPKREREDSSAERTRAWRERQKQEGDAQPNAVTPSDATERQRTPRGEESRSNTPPPPLRGEPETGGGFARFWAAWPSHDRKVARHQCWAKWRTKGCEEIADRIIAHVEAMKRSEAWLKQGGEFVPAPLVYLNQSRWEAVEISEQQRSSMFEGAV